MNHIKKQAFTLVELIIVITILAILGTIAFISLQGYSTSSRNSVRISDLSTMKTSLELFNLDAGKYPETSTGFDVIYSGSIVWTQGIFGESTTKNVEKLDKIPKDPLTDKEYTYSITKTKQEYQLAGLIEGNEIVLNGLNTQTNAGDTIAIAIVMGNYNGQTLKAQTGTTCEILSIPSIISSEGDTVTDLKTILDNENLVYNGYNNLPSNYIGSKYKTDEGFLFTSEKLVVYIDYQECKPLYTEDPTARINLVKNLQTAYSGTILENNDNIKGLVAIDVMDLELITLLSTTLVNNNLGGEIKEYTIDTTFTVILDVNGGIGGTQNVTATYNSAMPTLATVPTKTGYIFNGYFSAASGGTKYYNSDKSSAKTYTLISTTTLYAQWISNLPTCNTGYTYNTTTNLCQKSDTVAATTSTPTWCTAKFTGVSDSGTLNGDGVQCSAGVNSQCTYYASSRYLIKFDGNCNVYTWSRDLNFTGVSAAVGSSGVYTSGWGIRHEVYNITAINYTCLSDYTLSGSTCSRTLTEIPICSIGVLNTDLDICVVN
ncbi:MAG: InlB B-repeat-containing protein [Candidatus Gracilibacteria bacterium]